MMTITEAKESIRKPWKHALPGSIWVAGISSPYITGDDILIRRLPEDNGSLDKWSVLDTDIWTPSIATVLTDDIDSATEVILVYADNPHQAVYPRDQHIIERQEQK